MTVTFGDKCGRKTEVYMDGEYIGALYPKEITTYGLEDGAEVGEEITNRIIEEKLLPGAKRYVMDILVKSDRTEAELRRKLKEKGYSEEISDKAIEYVKGFHYIDELRTAENFIRSRMDSLSEKEIRYKLSGKGIEDGTVDMAYDRILEDEDGEAEYPELKAALNFVRKKLGATSLLDEDISYEEKQKLMAAAYRKGFRQESIRSALKKLAGSE